MPQSSLGFVIVDGNTRVFEEREIFLLVSPKRFFEFGKRSRVSAVALSNLIEYQLEFLFQIGRYVVPNLFLYGVIQLRELSIGLHNLFLLSFTELSAFCHISQFPLRMSPAELVLIEGVLVCTIVVCDAERGSADVVYVSMSSVSSERKDRVVVLCASGNPRVLAIAKFFLLDLPTSFVIVDACLLQYGLFQCLIFRP